MRYQQGIAKGMETRVAIFVYPTLTLSTYSKEIKKRFLIDKCERNVRAVYPPTEFKLHSNLEIRHNFSVEFTV